MKDIGDLYADYKTGKISRSTYFTRRAAKLDQFRRNIGPLFERMLYPDKGVSSAMRGRKNLLPNSLMAAEAARLQRIAKYAARGGVVLSGIGVTSACIQIAQTVGTKEKNEIFVDTIVSTSAGFLVGLFVVSNPIGWGSAIVLATGGALGSYLAGKLAAGAYDLWGNNIDLVSGAGVNRICR